MTAAFFVFNKASCDVDILKLNVQVTDQVQSSCDGAMDEQAYWTIHVCKNWKLLINDFTQN